MKTANFTGIVQKAVFDHNMINEGDSLCIGVSGGKDSLACLHALAAIKEYSPVGFSLCAITLDLGLAETDFAAVADLCADLGVPYYIENTQIGEIVINIRKEKSPCSLCANLRRGALNRKAKALGCNKVVLGHNRDDAIETFLMSLIFEGRVHCFSPVTYLSRADIHVIRPLIYAEENEILEYCSRNDLFPVKSPCPVTGMTSRQKTREMINSMASGIPDIRQQLFHALSKSDIEGWTIG